MKRANSCVCVEPQIQEKKKQRSNPPKATEARRGGSPDGDSEDILGRDVRLIKRHKYDGSVSKNPKRNNFIDAGRLKNVYGPALDKVYGKDEDGNPCKHAVQFGDSEFNNYTSSSLFVLQQKTVYAHDDKSVRPFLLIDTAGPYLSDTDMKKLWLAFIDVENMECIQYTEVNFKFPPSQVSWLSATEALQFTMSSPLT